MTSRLRAQQIMPEEWGAKVLTDQVVWSDDAAYMPQVTVIHYGGGQNPAGGDAVGLPPYSAQREAEVLRIWEGYHRNSKGMRSIAYNEGFGQTGRFYWLRGPNHANGGQYGDINRTSRAVVFILGGGQVPSHEARRKFGRLWLEEPLGDENEVAGHEDFGDTSCPGAFLRGWIDRKGWLYDLGEWSEGMRGGVVSSIKVALHRQGLWSGRFGREFTPLVTRRVRRFQAQNLLLVDGIVGAKTFDVLGRP